MPKPPFTALECERPKIRLWTWVAEFLADNKTIVSACSGQHGAGGCVSLTDADSGKILKSAKAFPDHNGSLKGWITPDRRQLLVAHETTEWIDTATLKIRPAFDCEISHACFSPDSQLMAIKDDNGLKVLKISNQAEVATFSLEGNYLGYMTFWHNPTELLIVLGSGPAVIWDFKTGEKRECKKESGGNAMTSPDGKTLASFSGGKNNWVMTLTDLAIGKSKKTTPFRARFMPEAVFSPDNTRLVVTAMNKELIIWDTVANAVWLKWSKPHCHDIRFPAYSPDGRRLVCTADSQLDVLDFNTDGDAKPAAAPEFKPGEHACVEMVGPDDRMDHDGGYYAPLNPLPVSCPACQMVNLDTVASPYLVGRKITAPLDMSPAQAGNFLVRESMKQVLETVAPGQCTFHPTANVKTKQPTPWFLAVPVQSQFLDQPLPQKCPNCAAPWDYEWQDAFALANPMSKNDVFKAANWHANSSGFKSWSAGRREDFSKQIDRSVYFSVRLETLIKKLGLRGMVRSSDSKAVPSPGDLAWVGEKLSLLKKSGPATGKSDLTDQWFKEYLKKNTRKKPAVPDFAAFEKKHALKLPDSYKKFMSAVGVKSFSDVDDEDRFTVHILPPGKLKLEDCSETDDEVKPFKGLLFATTDHGDAFYFVLAKKESDLEVRKLAHELDSYEPYAANFAAAIKRFRGE